MSSADVSRTKISCAVHREPRPRVAPRGGAGDRHRGRVRVAPRSNSRCRRAAWSEPAGATGGADRRARPQRLGQVDAGCRCHGSGHGERRPGQAVRTRRRPTRSRGEREAANGARRRRQPAVRSRPARRPRLPRQRRAADTTRPIRSHRGQTGGRCRASTDSASDTSRTRRPSSLSGGERQRVALAAALAHGPGLVIADEPTGELDAVSADQVYDFLREHAERTGAALLVVTHDARARANRHPRR